LTKAVFIIVKHNTHVLSGHMTSDIQFIYHVLHFVTGMDFFFLITRIDNYMKLCVNILLFNTIGYNISLMKTLKDYISLTIQGSVFAELSVICIPFIYTLSLTNKFYLNVTYNKQYMLMKMKWIFFTVLSEHKTQCLFGRSFALCKKIVCEILYGPHFSFCTFFFVLWKQVKGLISSATVFYEDSHLPLCYLWKK
jgi:hypothetical protein